MRIKRYTYTYIPIMVYIGKSSPPRRTTVGWHSIHRPISIWSYSKDSRVCCVHWMLGFGNWPFIWQCQPTYLGYIYEYYLRNTFENPQQKLSVTNKEIRFCIKYDCRSAYTQIKSIESLYIYTHTKQVELVWIEYTIDIEYRL